MMMSVNFIEFYKNPINEQGDILSIERAVHAQDDLLFLEDVIESNKREVIAVTRKSNKLLCVDDQGVGEEFDITSYCKKKIKNCHTLKNGNRILQTAEPCDVYLVDRIFGLIKKVDAGRRLWHGSNSVDSTSSGVVMYSEYIATKEKGAQPLYVWRSYDHGKTWDVAMKKMSSPVYGVGECRHFHTCFSDPDIESRWYVTTGDIRGDNCFFYSDDDGKAWKKACVRSVTPGGLIPELSSENIFRFTSSYFDGNNIVWPTDDGLGVGKAMLIRMDKTTLPSVDIEIEHVFDENLMRSAIADERGRHVYISEAKHNLDGLSIYIKDDLGKVKMLPTVNNLSGDPSGGTISKSSGSFFNDIAFSLADVRLFGDGRPSLLRYQFKKSTVPVPVVEVPSKKDVVGRPLVFFHAQRTAGTTIKSAFQNEFGKDGCLYQRTSNEFCDWRRLDGVILNKYRIYAGHYNYASKDLAKEPLLFSIIRDPVDRAISLYHYLKNRPEHKLHELAVSKNILNFYVEAEKIAPNYVSNTQTLRVSGTLDFAVARRVVEDKYFFIAPFDRLKEVFEVFSDYKILSAGSIPPKVKKKAFDSIYYDQEFRSYIEDLNSSDVRLYEYSNLYFKAFGDGM
jgi:hypothetical protein